MRDTRRSFELHAYQTGIGSLRASLDEAGKSCVHCGGTNHEHGSGCGSFEATDQSMPRTPGPWRVHRDRTFTDRGASINRVSDPSIGALDLIGDSMRPDDAAFIVLACNAHDALTAENAALREALTDVTAWFRDVPGAMTNGELLLAGCPNDLAATLAKARAALAKDGAR